MADDETRKKYGIDELLDHIPADRAEFFSGFVPWPEDLDGWRVSTFETEPEVNGRSHLRTIWDNTSDRDSRILIDVTVCSSAEDAVEALATQLSYNQLDRLPNGPADLGLISFVHPDPAPPAIFFVRGNLSILVTSFGRKAVPIQEIARRQSARLAERPRAAQSGLVLAADSPAGKAGQDIGLSFSAPFQPGANGYWKFFVTGGTAARRQGRLLLRPSSPGRLRVEAFLVESGRAPYFGELALLIE
jgi:hypothetical protein